MPKLFHLTWNSNNLPFVRLSTQWSIVSCWYHDSGNFLGERGKPSRSGWNGYQHRWNPSSYSQTSGKFTRHIWTMPRSQLPAMLYIPACTFKSLPLSSTGWDTILWFNGTNLTRFQMRGLSECTNLHACK